MEKYVVNFKEISRSQTEITVMPFNPDLVGEYKDSYVLVTGTKVTELGKIYRSYSDLTRVMAIHSVYGQLELKVGDSISETTIEEIKETAINNTEFEEEVIRTIISGDHKRINDFITISVEPRKLRVKNRYEDEIIYLSYIFEKPFSQVYIQSAEMHREISGSNNIIAPFDAINLARVAMDKNIDPSDFSKGSIYEGIGTSEKLIGRSEFNESLKGASKELGIPEEYFLAYKAHVGESAFEKDPAEVLSSFYNEVEKDISLLKILEVDKIVSLYDQEDANLLRYAEKVFSSIRLEEPDIEYCDGVYYRLMKFKFKEDAEAIVKDPLLPLYIVTESEGRMPDFVPDGSYYVAFETVHEILNGLEYFLLEQYNH